jgi:hypothetical protein
VHAHDPDQHRPIHSRDRSDAVLPRFRGKAARRRGIISLSGIMEGGATKLEAVGAGNGIKGCLLLSMATSLGMVALASMSGAGKHRG